MKFYLALSAFAVFILLSLGVVYYTFYLQNQTPKVATNQVKNFDECQAAGYPITKTAFQKQCVAPDNKKYLEDIGNTIAELADIKVASPAPNEAIKSPLTIYGQALGSWFSSGSVQVKLEDSAGKTLGQASLKTDRAVGDQKTFYPFSGTLNFSSTTSKKGTLTFIGPSNTSLHFPLKLN